MKKFPSRIVQTLYLGLTLLLGAQNLIAQDGPDQETQIRNLIPLATAMDTKMFERIATSASSPKPSDFNDNSLSFALLVTDYKTAQASGEQFQYLTQKSPKPNLLAKEMYRSIGGGRFRIVTHPVTMIQQNRITHFEVKIEGESATGTFKFHVPNLYKGTTDFMAEKSGAKWRITRLQMPGLKIDLQADKSNHWWYSKNLEDYDLPKCLIGHSGTVFDLDFSRDGKHIVSGGSDQGLRVWSVADSTPTLTIPRAHSLKLGSESKGWILSVAFGPDQQRIASSSDDGTAKIWNASTGELERTIEVQNIVNEVRFSPDGDSLLTSGSEIEIWDTTTGELRQTIEGPSFPAIAIAPTDFHIVTASPKSQLWNAKTGKLLATSKEYHSDLVTDIDFSPDAKRFASCGRDQTIRVWNATDLRQLIKIDYDQKGLQSLSWSPNGQLIVTGDNQGQVNVWSSTTGKLHQQLPKHPSSVRCVEFHPEGKQIATAGGDGVIRFWDLK